MSNKISNIKERILYFLDFKKVTKSKFFEKIGMTYGNFTGKSKETPLNSDAIGNILLFFPDLNPIWLLIGEGEMLKNEEKKEVSVPATGQNTSILEQENAFLKRENELLQGQIKDKNKIITTLESNQKLLEAQLKAYEKSTHYATATQSATRPTL